MIFLLIDFAFEMKVPHEAGIYCQDTCFCRKNQDFKLVIVPLVDHSYQSQQGHIIVRVLPGGKNYYVIILDDSHEAMLVKNVFGPYTSKQNQPFEGANNM